ncbi:MAG TPA: GNAT family N-acetyltransferase [Rectinemataceae bacterium]|nr:GNAT family N-acetyltransferase [Rectinemataceae bacterium]
MAESTQGSNGAIRIIPYERRFERDLIEICWRTGFMGESLEGLGRFDDRKLFALRFVLQFPRTWPGTCWVAVMGEKGSERAVGYIVGTVDAKAQAQAAKSLLAWRWRLLLRLYTVSWWRYPESFRQSHSFGGSKAREVWADPEYREADYPACLHMNLLPDCQGQGAGTRLMRALLDELKKRGVPGIHLGTSDLNVKAVPFYKKMGFKLVRETEGEFWSGVRAHGLDFALKI